VVVANRRRTYRDRHDPTGCGPLIPTKALGDTHRMDQRSTPASPAQFDHFGISVTDLGRSLDFYCEVLGAVVLARPHSDDQFNFRRVVVTLDGPVVFDINEFATNSRESFDPSRTGLDHLAFSVPSREALVAWAAHVDSKGVAHSPIRDVRLP
jgi:glyoxylase I family protein